MKTKRIGRSGLLLMVILFGLCCFTLVAQAEETTDETQDVFISSSFCKNTNVLNIPELKVEGTDLVYRAKLLMKQEDESSFLQLTELAPSQYQEPSITAATLSSTGTINIPFLLVSGDTPTFWSAELSSSTTDSSLPLKFSLADMSTIENADEETEDLLGVDNRLKCVCAKLCPTCIKDCLCCIGDYCFYSRVIR